MKKKMKKKSFSFVLVLFLMTALLPMTPSAQATNGQTGVEVRETVTRESTVYAGEIFVDGQSAMKYLYSTDLSNHSQVFKNLQDALAGTAFDGLVPTITGESETRGLAVSSAHAEDMNADWTSAAAVAKLFYTGTPGAETNGNLYDLNAAYREYIDSRYQEITETYYTTPHSFDKRLDSTLNTTTDFVWVQHDGKLVKEYTVTASTELTTVFYTSVNVTTAPTNYTVTYKVVNGTWSDGSTADRTETVTSGASPASVPTGMKASSGYTGGAWDTNPADATIMGATTFTYTFTAKQAATVTKAPEVKTLTYTGSAQELVTAGEATGGTMQYAIGDANGAAQPYTTSIPAKTEAGTYYIWYRVDGDENHNDSGPACVTAVIKKKPAAVSAKAQTIREGGSIAAGTDQAVLTDAVSGHVLSGVSLSADSGKNTIKPAKAKIEDAAGKDVTENYSITYENGTLTVLKAIRADVTFRVVNGFWNDGTATEKTVTLTGYEGDSLKLSAEQIPAAGGKPAADYTAGTWDKTPDTATAVTENTVFTYTYAAKPAEEKPVEDNSEGQQGENKPAEDQPGENKPAEDQPAENKPAEDQQGENKPAEDQQGESKPAEEQPGENKPVEEKTAEEKPADSEPAVPESEEISKTKTVVIPLMAKAVVTGDKTVKITWNKIKQADRYVIYMAECNSRSRCVKTTLQKVKTIKGNTTTSWTKKKLVKGQFYKFRVVAQQKVAKNTYKTLKQSAVGHFVAGNESKKYTNPKSLTLNKTSVTLKKGKKVTITGRIKLVKPKKKLLDHSAQLRFISSDKKVAKVNSAGQITAVKKGTCRIYVQAVNGIWKTVKVTVK